MNTAGLLSSDQAIRHLCMLQCRVLHSRDLQYFTWSCSDDEFSVATLQYVVFNLEWVQIALQRLLLLCATVGCKGQCWCRWIQEHLDAEQQLKFHFFNTFFFKKLTEKSAPKKPTPTSIQALGELGTIHWCL